MSFYLLRRLMSGPKLAKLGVERLTEPLHLNIASAFVALGLVDGGLIISGCGQREQPMQPAQMSSTNGMVIKQYTCTMHPEVVLGQPGKCPKCAMELVEKH